MRIYSDGLYTIFQDNGLHIYLHSDINEKPESIFFGSYKLGDREMSITARGLMMPRYSALSSLYTDSTKQYCEVGPGFSGIFPYLDKIEFEQKPIIVDPAPYEDFLRFLNEIEERLGSFGNPILDSELTSLIDEYNRDDEYLPRIQETIKNLNWYLNPNNCRFINKTIGDAVVEDNLIGILDGEPRSNFSAEHFQWGVGTSKRNKSQLEKLVKEELGKETGIFFLSQDDFTSQDVYGLMLKSELRNNN